MKPRYSSGAELLALALVLAAAALMGAILSTQAMAQATTGTIKGTIVDENGAVIPVAIVVAKNEATGVSSPTFKSTGNGVFVIPNLMKEDKRIPISSVVLSGQRQDLRDALYTAGKDKDQVANPLVDQGQKLIPSVTRVFSKSKDMYVYLQAYQQDYLPNAQSIQPLVAFVTFYRGQNKAFETAPLPVTEGINNRLKTIPLRFSLPLDKLPPGRYNCQVTVLDPTAQKAAFWQAPVMLIP